jgi:hypothetical protein
MVTGAPGGPRVGESRRGTEYLFSSAEAETVRRKNAITSIDLFMGASFGARHSTLQFKHPDLRREKKKPIRSL